jgi:hypothetical protein
VFVANSFQDQLFPPGQMRRFYEGLRGPKKFYMDRGIHASSALPGLFGLPSAVWDDVHDWMGYWLKDEGTGIMARPSVTFQSPAGREDYWDLPKTHDDVLEARGGFPLVPVNPLTSISSLEALDAGELGLALKGGGDSAATSGIPVLSE